MNTTPNAEGASLQRDASPTTEAVADSQNFTVPIWVYSLAAIHEELNKASLAHAAEAYAELGFPVFPLIEGQKIPFKGTNGKDDAVADIDRVVRFWSKRPDANIGFATGTHASVLDIDTKRDVDGWVACRRLAKAGLLTGAFAQVASPSRGKPETGFGNGGHLYFAPQGKGHSLKAALDYKSVGGYVLLPPSRINVGPDNEQGQYLWEDVQPEKFGPTLDWDGVLEVLNPPRVMHTRKPAGRGGVSALANTVRNAPEGSRHNILVWATCAAVNSGLDPELLREAALEVGHTEKQTTDAIEWALENAGGAR